MAHTAFAGVAVGLFVNAVFDVGVSPYVSAAVVAMVAALCITTAGGTIVLVAVGVYILAVLAGKLRTRQERPAAGEHPD